MKIKLSIFLICTLLFTPALASCDRDSGRSASSQSGTPIGGAPVMAEDDGVKLPASRDGGSEYIDSFVFIGESTTYHMKSRGVLSGGRETKQIWAPPSGTLNLDLTVDSVKIDYPETGEALTIAEAAQRKKPAYVMLTFGLNGAVQNIRRGEKYYKNCYLKLINLIRDASPETVIILQSGFPVAKNMDMSSYTVTLDELNSYIDTINSWVYELARDEGLRYLDTSSILKDENNRLKSEYQAGDGYHLTTAAYREILYYIRTHMYV